MRVVRHSAEQQICVHAFQILHIYVHMHAGHVMLPNTGICALHASIGTTSRCSGTIIHTYIHTYIPRMTTEEMKHI